MRRFPTRQLRKVLNLSFFRPTSPPAEAKRGAALPPGTMVYIGEEREGPVDISAITYHKDGFTEQASVGLGELPHLLTAPGVSWINLDGIHDLDTINQFASQVGLHPLTKEDIVDTTLQPKIERSEGYLHLALKMFSVREQTGKIDIEQVNLILGKSFVISLQEKTEDVLEPIRNRIRTGTGRVRKKQADYLFYAIADIIASHYLIAISHIARQIDYLEEEMADKANPSQLTEISTYLKTLLHLRRYIAPLREQIILLQRQPVSLIGNDMAPYLHDLEELLSKSLSEIDTYRDILKNLNDQYLGMASHKMNEVMKVLTIVSTIFIPLSFLAGLYGMNFTNMPELTSPNGYPILLVVMGVITVGMLVYFRVKKWL